MLSEPFGASSSIGALFESVKSELIIGASVEDVMQIHLSDLTLEDVREALDRLLKAVV